MATYRATTGNDAWTVPEFGDPSGTLIDGLAGTDYLYFDRLPRSRFTIKQDAATGNILVDSVSGASSTFHLKLKNVEYLVFSSGSDVVNLTTMFGDTTPPVVSQFTPASGAFNVAADSNITITFSENVVRGSGNITLLDPTGKAVETFAVATSTNLAVSNTQLVINPTNDLLLGKLYTVKIDAGAIKDVAGNAYAGTSTYSFSTPANHNPNAEPGQFSLTEGTLFNGQLPKAIDPDPQTLTYALSQNAAHGLVTVNKDGSFSYAANKDYSGIDTFTYVANDGIVNSSAAFVTLTIASLLHTFTGTSGNDVLSGTVGKDIFQGGAGNDSLDGGAGLDIAAYSGVRSNYQITVNAGTVQVTDQSGTDGNDTLQNIERLNFSDSSIALDISGAAGSVAKTIGAVFGVAGLSNKTYIGQALKALDAGTSYEQLLVQALNTALGPNATSAQIVDLVYMNVIGSAPPAGAKTYYMNLLDSGAFSLGKLAAIAADTGYNAAHINLVGLAQTGLEFIPAP